MKKIYFCATDGSSMVGGQLPYATKEAEANCNKMFDMLHELGLDLNMALCSSKKEMDNLAKKWDFDE